MVLFPAQKHVLNIGRWLQNPDNRCRYRTSGGFWYAICPVSRLARTRLRRGRGKCLSPTESPSTWSSNGPDQH